ncbi:MAG: pyridoxal phosphate-dependent aminotransferase [bacterium]
MNFAKRIEKIQPSQTVAVTGMVAALRRQGKNVIDLGAGEPDFDTPQVIKEAAIGAIKAGFTKYTPNTGFHDLKVAICAKLANDNHLQYAPEQIVVTCGAKHAIINTLLALCEEGDEVLIPSPYWTSYPEQVRFVGATPVYLQTDESTNFKIVPDQLKEAMTSQTKLLILNSPANPTGAVYSKTELETLYEVLKETNTLVISDEIYEKIIYDGQPHVSIASFASFKERVILVNGVSKAFAMTGWRIGYLAATPEIVKAVSKIQSHSTSNPCSISQKASLAALSADQGIVKNMVLEFDRRRRFLVDRLNGLPGIHATLPQGAFYMFPNVSKYFGLQCNGVAIHNTSDFCQYVLQENGVALVPGEAFGSKEHIRISYAASLEVLEKAVARIGAALRKLT